RAGQKRAFRRVEVRCSDYAQMARQERENLLAYTASPDPRPRPQASFASAEDSASGGARRASTPPPSSPSSPPSPPPATPLQLPAHVGAVFRITVEAPSSRAQPERYVGIEVASRTHRFLLHDSVVTSNCAPEVIQRRPYDSTVDNWTL